MFLMKPTTKNKIANSLGANPSFNKKVLNLKSSWDTVGSIIQNTKIGQKKPTGRTK